jgi:hypothetical protein
VRIEIDGHAASAGGISKVTIGGSFGAIPEVSLDNS